MLNELKLVNAYDEIVKSQVKQLMETEEDMCKCEKCFLDVCAIVFNRGYCNFVTTSRGQTFTRIEESAYSNRVDLTIAVMEAIRIVKASPMH